MVYCFVCRKGYLLWESDQYLHPTTKMRSSQFVGPWGTFSTEASLIWNYLQFLCCHLFSFLILNENCLVFSEHLLIAMILLWMGRNVNKTKSQLLIVARTGLLLHNYEVQSTMPFLFTYEHLDWQLTHWERRRANVRLLFGFVVEPVKF